MNGNSKTTNHSAILSKALPFIALAGAAISLIFTFLIGVSVSGGTTGGYFIYHFFEGDFIKTASLLEGANSTAFITYLALGIILTLVGIIAVLAFTGLTVYSIIRKYAFKKAAKVELYSICTFLSYALFAGLFYSFNYADVSFEGLKIATTYNIPTVIGLILSSLIFCVYAVLKTLENKPLLADKEVRVHFIYSAARLLVSVLIIALITAPAVFVNMSATGTVGTETVTVNAHYSLGLMQLIYQGYSSSADKLSSLISSAACGFIVECFIVVLFAFLSVKMLSTIFDKKRNDNIFYIACFIAALAFAFFATVAGGFFTDLKDLVTLDGASDIVNKGRINVAIPLVVFGISVISFVMVAIHNTVVAKASKENVKNKEEGVPGEEILLEVNNLCKHFVIGTDFFGRPTKTLKAVDNVTFKLEKGKTLGIVGESGCGKTTMGRTILRLYDVTSGDVWFKGQKISTLSNREFDKLRPNMQMIFQDPYASLSPRLTVGEIIGEAVKQHKLVSKKEYHDYILSVMKMCGLQPHYFERYPHEFSGGQRQRICIARALALKPDLVVCDEPVSALDVSIQAQIINMLIELRENLGLTYVFISHDLSVIKHISDNVGVMYLGSMVEYGSKGAIFGNTLHPYTRALFSAVPVPDPHVKMNRIILKGDIPSPVNPPKGCKFHTRCESCMDICTRINPAYKEVEEGHFCACHLYNTEEETSLLEQEYEKEQARLQKQEEAQANKKHKKKKSVKEAEADDVPKE